ncbi:MAG: ferredoxin [Alphaproteobacteria bacterium]|nr:ferredoxin [Alphaproteobacteria bacterium]MDP6567935.1 ferredoxin [Alphaproteobacteria bacterium]MDP6812345.1 ferredoxin [Alphaproteobacteria bacterium]
MPRRTYSLEINEGRCRACAVCWEICHTKVLGFRPPLNKAVVEDIGACTGCRLCEWLCPDFAIVLRQETAPATEAVS